MRVTQELWLSTRFILVLFTRRIVRVVNRIFVELGDKHPVNRVTGSDTVSM